MGCGRSPDRIVIDVDATLINAHTEKEGAAVNYRSGFEFGFGFGCWRIWKSPDALAGVLRGGGAPAHSSQAQIDVPDLALAQLPVDACLVGFDLFTGVRESILQLPEDAWRPALRLLVIAAADPLGEAQQLLRRPRPRTRRPARQGSMTTHR